MSLPCFLCNSTYAQMYYVVGLCLCALRPLTQVENAAYYIKYREKMQD